MTKFDLFLFLKSIEDLKEEHISSLQSFESSLLLVMHDRWIAAVISITNSIETLLRMPYGRNEDLSGMIDLAVKDSLISRSLGDRGHEIRKLRNQFIHSMVSPRDNPTAAYAYIVKAIPLYRRLVSSLLNGIDVFDFVESEKIKLIYELTRNSILQSRGKQDREEVPLDSLSVFKKSIVNTTFQSIAPLWVSDKIEEWQKDFENLEYPSGFDKLVDRYKDELDWLSLTSILDLGDDLFCPAQPCTGHLILEITGVPERIDTPIDVVERARCPLCDLLIEDRTQLQAFVEPQLSSRFLEEQIEELHGLEINLGRYLTHVTASMVFRLKLSPIRQRERKNLPEMIVIVEGLMDKLRKMDIGEKTSWFSK